MSAECSECGADLAYDLSCSRCEWRTRALAAESELRALKEDLAEAHAEGIADFERLQLLGEDLAAAEAAQRNSDV